MPAPDPTPKPRKPARVMLSVRVSRNGLDRMRAAAAKRGITQSDAIRAALAEWTTRNS